MFKTTLALALAASAAIAGNNAITTKETPKEQSAFDRLWDLPVLYKNKENPFIQEFRLQGRLHLQYANGSSDQGSYDSADRPDESLWGDSLEVRRWRIGFKSTLFHKLKVEGLINISPDWEPEFYEKIYNLAVTWELSDKFDISLGKFKANVVGLEHNTSSNEILTPERGLLSNMMYPGELTGLRFKSKVNGWLYGLSAYMGDDVREFTQDAEGHIFQAYIGRDLKKEFGIKKATFRLEYQHSTDPANAGGGGLFANVVVANAQLENDRWTLQGEAVYAAGQGTQGDVFGAFILPTYNITDKLQVVGRYQYANGDHDALRLQSRYERLAPALTDSGRGETYHAAYFGVNYYIYGHKLKLMAGTEYHHMDGGGDGGDFDGWTSTVGLRMSF